jgi:hypothetical protein
LWDASHTRLRDIDAIEDAEIALATLPDALKCPLGIPPGAIPEELVHRSTVTKRRLTPRNLIYRNVS